MIRAINHAGRFWRRFGEPAPRLDASALEEKAKKSTGLSDLGDPTYREGFTRLIQELNANAKLSQLGQIAAYFNLLDYLEVRLQLINYRAQRPEVTQQAVTNPLVVLGLPRTGTTILYELLAQDSAHRYPASWEIAKPFPPATSGSVLTDQRIKTVDRQFNFSERLSPGFKAIHAIGAVLPQECVYLFSSHFMSEQFGYMYDIPDYREWVIGQDMTNTYRWHHHFLQHLQADYAKERWLLKTPSHLAYLNNLLKQYPNAAIVWTHRDPLQAVSSFASLVSTLRSGFSDSVDPHAIGRTELTHQAKIVERGMEHRKQLPSQQFCDIGFAQIQNDPMAAIQYIYEHFGFELTTTTEQKMRDYLRARPQNLYGEHSYSAEQFGICENDAQRLFSGYLNQYSPLAN